MAPLMLLPLLACLPELGNAAASPSPPSPPPPPAPPSQNNWAVIAVGSYGYANYRHQAGACQAYQNFRKRGFPADNIILMMYDDVASAKENPFPGKLFTKPGDTAQDVYAGCKIDYKGPQVTAKLFLQVLTGDSSAGGKVLKSTHEDHVFVYFADHGGVGLVGFPNGPALYAEDLSTALKTMQQKNMFKDMVFYMEACESGSMFPKLETDGKIIAITATNAEEPSWGFHCGPAATVNGKHLHTCLGDVFSGAWMDDADGDSETIATQIQRVAKKVTKSHVQVIGDVSFRDEVIRNPGGRPSQKIPPADELDVAINSRDIGVNYYETLCQVAKNTEKTKACTAYQQALADRHANDEIFASIISQACKDQYAGCTWEMANFKMQLSDVTCHQALVETIHNECGWDDYNMKYSQALVNLCESSAAPDKLTKNARDLGQIVKQTCADANRRLAARTGRFV